MDEATPMGARRMTAIRRYECPHLQASGWLQSLRCGICGPLRATWVQRPVISHLPPVTDAQTDAT